MQIRVEIDNNAGFCFGVIKAIKMAEEELEHDEMLYSLGDIVHNGEEVARLNKMGLKSISREEYFKLKDCKVLIRAHGQPPEIYEYAAENNIRLIDATCPVVLNIQKKIRDSYKRCTKNNGQIVIFGKKGHAEVIGLVGQTRNNAVVVEGMEDMHKIDFTRPVCIYSQTTKSIEDFYQIIEKIKTNMKPGVCLEIHDTICRHVSNRVPLIKQFAVNHHIILFVAGEKSSNGRLLYNICRKENPNTYYISRIDEIDPEWFKGVESVGISGATSTPNWLMEKVAGRVKEIIPISEMFAQVILPLSLSGKYTYRVPAGLQDHINTGLRVVVQFGRRRFFSAIVTSLSEESPGNIETKQIIQVLDEHPVVLSQNLKLWEWTADYYCCNLGDIYRAAMPPGLKLESKSQIFLTGEDKEIILSEREQIIIDGLNKDNTLLERLQKDLGKDFSYKALNLLLEKNIIRIDETINTKYKPKTLTFIRLDHDIKTEEHLNQKIEELQRAKKQQALLIHFCDKTGAFGDKYKLSVSKKDLLGGTGFSSSILNELIKKKILSSFQQKVSRIESFEEDRAVGMNILNEYQKRAYDEIKRGFDEKQVVLIHGITASGKTEIYIKLIEEFITAGQQVLYLVPEIVLTAQIISRLKNVFSERVGIYHSRLNGQERVEIWEKVLKYQTDPGKSYQIILGTRSSVFLPFSRLGLIIVDEEHENSFKQSDPAPRYNARDVSVILGMQNNARVLLGSATPSYESYYNALSGKYKLVSLEKRHLSTELPEIIVADIRKSVRKRQMRSVLTDELYRTIKEALDKNEQVILFQNRRGYSPYVQCFDCGWIPKCKNCDVSLTYHKYKKQLTCHYCGYSEEMPDKCGKCGSSEINKRGYGTEKIEDELKLLFPDNSIERMDLDTTHSKNAFSKIIGNLETGKIDILIGTQMVTKGLDLEHVTVVGILNADNLIDFPDFRAHERAFQLIYQVSGRAGRRNNRGKVVMQTYHPEHPLIKLLRANDYRAVYHMQMEERRLFKYPPYYRLIKLIIKHRKSSTVNRVAERLAQKLKAHKSIIILGPEYPLVGKIKQHYQKEIWLKISRELSPAKVKKVISYYVTEVKKWKDSSNCIINIDVDPA
jgi:primosomal protein N' (replication factor Y) (superfamily II helicase)